MVQDLEGKIIKIIQKTITYADFYHENADYIPVTVAKIEHEGVERIVEFPMHLDLYIEGEYFKFQQIRLKDQGFCDPVSYSLKILSGNHEGFEYISRLYNFLMVSKMGEWIRSFERDRIRE